MRKRRNNMRQYLSNRMIRQDRAGRRWTDAYIENKIREEFKWRMPTIELPVEPSLSYPYGTDVYRIRAAEMFGVAQEDVTEEQCRAAKADLFRLLYSTPFEQLEERCAALEDWSEFLHIQSGKFKKDEH